jgi:hypothetical protein
LPRNAIPSFRWSLLPRFPRAALLGLACLVLCACLAPARANAAQTVVSLEFDDGTADQAPARSLLSSHNMQGTFFVNSGRISDPKGEMLTWSQLQDLASDGNEITGHTVDHVNLPQLEATDLDEAKRQICNDRVNLLNKGFQPTNFAYPYGAHDDTTKSLARDCGYNSARDTGGVVSPGICDGCPLAESIPPGDPYRTRTPENVKSTTSLDTIKGYVTQAENSGGGWVQIVFHHICDGCGQTWSITQADLTSFLDWLQPRAASGTVVKTVRQVVGGPVQPAVNGPAPTPLPGPNLFRNPSLEADADGDGKPDCWDPIGYGTNSATFTPTPDAHSGHLAERMDVTSFASGAQRLFSHMDLGGCAPTVTPGHNYTLSAYYKSAASPRFEIYTRDALGSWTFWTTTGSYTPSSSWKVATFTTPPIPDGVTALAVGFGLAQAGSVTMDDFGLVDRGVLPPPTNVLQNPGLEALPSGGGDPTCWGRSLYAGPSGGGSDGTWAHTTDAHGGTNAERATINTYRDGDLKIGSQQDSVVANPTGLSATASGSGGTLAAQTYYYVVTATNSRGETLPSNEVQATTSGSTGSVRLTWTAVSGATGYRVYRGTASGAEKLLTSVGSVTSYTDTGASTPGSQSPPTSNTALKVAPCAPTPIVGHSYQASAWYKTSSDASVRLLVYYRDASGNWIFWKDTPVPASTTWTQAITTTDAVPPGATALSVAMSLKSVGTMTADDFSLGDLTAVTDPPGGCIVSCDTTAPSATASSPAFSASSSFSVSYSAGDDPGGSGLARVDLYAKGPGDLSYSKVASDGSPGTSGSFPYSALGGDGSYSFYTVATDNAGNVQAAPVGAQTTTVVDGLAPSSAASATALSGSSSLTVDYSAADGGSDLARVDLYAKAPGDSDYSKVASDSSPSASGSFSYTAAAGDGSYSFYTVATDKAGNAEAAPSGADATTLVDATAPSSSASAPAIAVSAPITVSYTASDGGSGLASVELYVKKPGDSDYSKVASDSSPSASGSFSYTPDGGNGSYSFYTRASDRAGNTEAAPSSPDATTNYTGDVAPDTTAPQSSASAPSTTTWAPITVSYTASDNSGGSGLARVDLYVKKPGDSDYSKVATDGSPSASGSFSYTPDGSNGHYSFYTRATDTAGNVEDSPPVGDTTTSYTLDTAAPTSIATAPSYRVTTAVSVSYSASDTGGSGLIAVELWVKTPGAASYAKAATEMSPGASGSFSYTAAAGDGAYAFYTVAVDRAGNREAAPTAADATTTVDTAAPSAFQMADPGQYLSGTVTLAVSGAAPTDSGSGLASVQYQYRRTGTTGSWSAACTTTSSPWSCNWNTGAVAGDNYDLRAVATDRAGNATVASNAPLVGRTVDNTKPTAQQVATGNVSGGVRGKVETGDQATFTYSEIIKPSSILTGWSGASTAVRVKVIDAKGRDNLEVWTPDGSARLALANPLALGGGYVPSGGAVFNATMHQSGVAIMVTVGTKLSGNVNSAAVTGGTLYWTPDTSATDLAGNRVLNKAVSTTGPAF